MSFGMGLFQEVGAVLRVLVGAVLSAAPSVPGRNTEHTTTLTARAPPSATAQRNKSSVKAHLLVVLIGRNEGRDDINQLTAFVILLDQ